jgi:hypothetical protein
VRSYWLSSYDNIRASSANTLELIHDAFQPLSYWDGWQQGPNYQGVAMDTHIYQMFSDAVGFTSILRARITLFSRRRWIGRCDVQFPAHIDCVQRSGRPRGLQCERAVDNRWGMDPRHDGLREVS